MKEMASDVLSQSVKLDSKQYKEKVLREQFPQ